jgi:hypothetical protein
VKIQLPHSFSGIAVATMAAALIAASATAHADCGEPGQGPCTGPVPTVDQVVGLLSELTDPDRPAASKGDVVTPAFDPQQAKKLDFWLNANKQTGNLPMAFTASDIRPAPANFAGATVTAHENGHPTTSNPFPIVLVNTAGHWQITSDTAMGFIMNVWYHYGHRAVGGI